MVDKQESCAVSHCQGAAEQYRQLFEDAPVAYHELNIEGKIQRVNNTECRILEYTHEEMLDRYVWDFMAPQEVEKARNAFAFKLTGKKKPSAPYMRAYRTKSNREIILETQDHILHDQEGRVVGLRSALIDVTERIEEELSFRSEQRWLDRVFHCLKQSVVVLDVTGAVSFVNSKAENLLGWTSKDMVGISFCDKFPATFEPAPNHHEYTLHYCMSKPWKGTATYLTEQDEKLHAHVNAAPLRTPAGECIGVVMIWKSLDQAGSERE